MDTAFPPDQPTGASVRRDGVAAPPAPDVPGYRVERLLGRGGSAAVWLVRDDDGGRFALKVPAGGGSVSGGAGGAVSAFEASAFEARREVNILARLDHPHLLKLHGVVETNQGAGLLSGYAAGGSAAGLVAARGPVHPGETVSVLVGIAQALGYLHARGAAHGDVSPGNILFTAEGKPLLADFGSGRLLGEPGRPRLGTPGFQAPGNIPGADRPLGAAEDIFALAAVGWFLLTGRVPPPARERPPLSILVSGVGRELPALLEAGLAEDPASRPTADEFADAAYRSAPALPVDLVAAVHPEVHPELLTRRTRSAGSGAGGRKRRWRRRRRDAGGTAVPVRAARGRAGHTVPIRSGRRTAIPGPGPVRVRTDQGAGEPGRPAPEGGEARRAGHRRRSRSSAGSRVFPVAAAVIVAAVLILAGIALASPDLLRADARGSAASREGAPGSAGASPDASQGASPGASQGASPAVASPSSLPQALTPQHSTPQVSTPPALTRPAPDTRPSRAAAPPAAPGPGIQSAKTVEALRAETAAEDPVRALPALAELRSRAFSTADPGLLAHVNAPGSEAQLADQEQVARLADQGQVMAGLSMEVTVVDGNAGPAFGEAAPPVPGLQPGPPPSSPTAVLRVRMRVSPYTHTGAGGAVLRQEHGQQQEVLLVLARYEGAWRISRVLPPE